MHVSRNEEFGCGSVCSTQHEVRSVCFQLEQTMASRETGGQRSVSYIRKLNNNNQY